MRRGTNRSSTGSNGFRRTSNTPRRTTASPRGRVRESVDILQRVRELTVQGANGTYSKDEMKLIGNEVNELLKQLVDLGNAKNGEGNTVFSGVATKSLPFRTVIGNSAGAGEPVITNVDYIGNTGENFTEVSDGTI